MFRLLPSHSRANLTYISFVRNVYVHILWSQSVCIFITAKYKTVEKYVGNMWIKHLKIRDNI
jgi:hypothetical protein